MDADEEVRNSISNVHSPKEHDTHPMSVPKLQAAYSKEAAGEGVNPSRGRSKRVGSQESSPNEDAPYSKMTMVEQVPSLLWNF